MPSYLHVDIFFAKFEDIVKFTVCFLLVCMVVLDVKVMCKYCDGSSGADLNPCSQSFFFFYITWIDFILLKTMNFWVVKLWTSETAQEHIAFIFMVED
jgi:hypothetical protein